MNNDASIALHKRTISKLSVESAENKPISNTNPLNLRNLRSKRTQKASQNVQLLPDQDEISSLDSYSSEGYKRSSSVDSGFETESKQPKIVIEISFRLEIHQKRGPLYLSESLQQNPVNRGSRTKSISKKWSKKQLNDHTSKQKQLFLLIFDRF